MLLLAKYKVIVIAEQEEGKQKARKHRAGKRTTMKEHATRNRRRISQ